jgi:nucleoside-diphosphate-sugar epimerase
MPSPTSASPLHVVLGSGQVGPRLIDELLQRGLRVRAVRRGAPAMSRPGLEWLRGDLCQPSFAREAVRGAQVVYNTTNPEAYHRWEELLPPLVRSVRGAVVEAGAKLVVLDNLYMLGLPPTTPFDEDTPMQPRSRKGELRKLLAEELAQDMSRGLVATTGRAPDFFGPGAGTMSAFGDRLAHQLATGAAIEVFGDPELPRSYAFVPDVARGLAVLGTREESWGKVWHLPVAWRGTTRGLLEGIAAAYGTKAKLRRVPDALLAIAGVFNPTLGAIREMTYQWKAPFVVDDRRFRTTFSVEPTPAEEALRASAAALTGARAAA